ncbi:partial Manganese-binding lipoprotein MntA, partial [Methylacidimicrobium cyclopophantes]
ETAGEEGPARKEKGPFFVFRLAPQGVAAMLKTMKSRYHHWTLRSILLGLLAWGMATALGSSAEPLPSRPLRVVTTIAPLYSFVKCIAGEAVELSNLLPQNAEPHDYVLSPGDARRVADADLIIRNGLGLETFLEKALENVEPQKLLDASRGIPTLPQWVPPSAFSDGRQAGRARPNPHVWLDPLAAVVEVENIVRELCRRDGAREAYYRARGARLTERLRRLDDAYHRSLDPLPDKKMAADHDAFGYLAHRYGIEVVAVLEAGGHAGLSPRLLAWAMDAIVRERVPALFSEVNRLSPELRDISRETGIPVVFLDSMESGAPDADLYERVAEENRRILVRVYQRRSHAGP